MVYSTCTFSTLENEEMIGWFLAEYGDMVICPVERYPEFADGRPDQAGAYQTESLHHAVRIFPHRADGEGHFAVLLQKRTDESSGVRGCQIEEKGHSGDLQQRTAEKSAQIRSCQIEKKGHSGVLMQKTSDGKQLSLIHNPSPLDRG